MKKYFSYAIIVVLIITLCACSQNQQDLEYMTSESSGNGYRVIVWRDKTYVPYGALSAYGNRGKQIGIVDGKENYGVYECKGYSTDE